MKKYLLLLLMSLLPTLVWAQLSGGEVRKPNKPVVKNTTKPSPNQKRITDQGSYASQTSRRDRVIEKLVSNMVYVAGGIFTMGATSDQGNDAYDLEKPSHQVTLSSFLIGRFEVTQEEWEVVMGSNPSKFKGKSLPVESVSWKDCQVFIKKLNRLTGKSFRLPTEAEWEYAARGGSKSLGYKYSGGNDIRDVAWFYSNSNEKTHEVGQKHPNELELYDMSGNVLEWCNDWHGKYDNSSQTNPTGPSSGSKRVFRGGGWKDEARRCRVSDRSYETPSRSGNILGLRLALSSSQR